MATGRAVATAKRADPDSGNADGNVSSHLPTSTPAGSCRFFHIPHPVAWKCARRHGYFTPVPQIGQARQDDGHAAPKHPPSVFRIQTRPRCGRRTLHPDFSDADAVSCGVGSAEDPVSRPALF